MFEPFFGIDNLLTAVESPTFQPNPLLLNSPTLAPLSTLL
ncbi:hypothetical protein LEP1GSC125_0484 [Leptospira mayottensis 200901122]|uniref:Uncharacterized protein n=1 Tax=Leptospira mayottensis 200901122 TaxID=1193010 RepID=A0AA87SWQ3_9LEPT|nr:hypothetical protein LEP1GSC125_0484 [Leptospira mayottensis 200901122]